MNFIDYLRGLNRWQDWMIGIGSSLLAAAIVWLLTKFTRKKKTPRNNPDRKTLKMEASPTMSQTFQPTINIYPSSQQPPAATPLKETSANLEPKQSPRDSRALSPELEIDFQGNDSNIVHTEHMRGGSLASMIYVRVRVRNKGTVPAKNCRVYLIGLKEIYPSGPLPTALDDTKVLAWAGSNFAPIDVPPEAVYYADVVRFSKHERGWLLSVDRLLATQQKLKDYVGTYRFRIMVAAENAAHSFCELDVYYNGDWHSLRAMSADVTR